jgi:hypothetical protein
LKKYAIGLLCLVFISCAGYKEIKPASHEFYALKKGDIIWVYTGIVDRQRLVFNKIEGDSLFMQGQSLHIDSVTRIQKEYNSRANTGVLVGGATTIVVISTILAVVAAITFYIKLASLI